MQLSAIVLAGGQSSRMGQDKALLQLGDRTLLQIVCQTALHCTDAVYVVTSRVDRYQPLVDDRVQFVPELAAQGPLVGFATALPLIQTEWVLLLACDLPNLQAAQLQTWHQSLSTVPSTCVAVLPRHSEGWWEALCGFYRQSCFGSLKAFVQQGGRSFQPWLAHQSVMELPVTDRTQLLNCNTPADWAIVYPDPLIN